MKCLKKIPFPLAKSVLQFHFTVHVIQSLYHTPKPVGSKLYLQMNLVLKQSEVMQQT